MIDMILEGEIPHRTITVKIVPYRNDLHHSLIPKLYSLGFNDNPWVKNWDSFKSFDPKGVFIAQVGEEMAGFITAYNRNDIGYISVLTVLPQFRGNGIAEDLIITAIDYLHSINLYTIGISIEEDNLKARRLYEKMGFAKTCIEI